MNGFLNNRFKKRIFAFATLILLFSALPVMLSDVLTATLESISNRSMQFSVFQINKLSPEETFQAFIRALLERDDKYAMSLMKNPPEILTYSNPVRVGYVLLEEGEVKEDKESKRIYVDAEVYWQYTASPYYQRELSRYFLVKSFKGYLIDVIQPLEIEEVFARDSEAGIVIYHKLPGGREEILFESGDIPSEYLPEGEFRMSCLYPDRNVNKLLFFVQAIDNQFSSSLLLFDNVSKEFDLITRLKSIVCSFLKSDTSFKFAVLDYLSYGDTHNPKSILIELETGKITNLNEIIENRGLGQLVRNYWEDGKIALFASKNSKITQYYFDPVFGLLEA